jgi:hypothetical protein
MALSDDVLVSRHSDNNIFHILYDLTMYYDPSYKNIYIYNDQTLDIENPCQKWRRYLLKRIFNIAGNVQYTSQLFVYNHPKRNPYDHIHYIKYTTSPIILEMLKNVIPPAPSKGSTYILLNQRRKNNRYVYDSLTGEPIHLILNKNQFSIPFRYCCFDEMTPEEQYDACSNAAIFISMHGAACTNLIFTPISTPLIEINFRKDWYCDPVCDAHFNQKIPFESKCDGSLIHPDYHKADFHNLCYLLGKKYYEITPEKYTGRFRDRNPISKENIHINGIYLIGVINALLRT